MTVENWLGVGILVSAFGGLFYSQARHLGLKATAVVWASSLCGVAVVTCGAWLAFM